MMVECGEGKWIFTMLVVKGANFDELKRMCEEISKLMTDDWELHGDLVSHDDCLIQAMMKFEPAEYETGDDDDGLPLPEAENEPIQEVRNCS